MSTVTYDTLAGSATQAVTYPSSSTIGYPSSNFYNVFGPVYLPRIYGKDLSAFEIASSGKIAVTLRDQWAFDLDRDSNLKTTSLATVAGDSFLIAANSNQTSILFDSTSNNLSLTASNTILFNAANLSYTVTGDNTVTAGGSINLNAGSNVNVNAKEDVILASSSNVIVKLDHTTCNLTEYARNDIIVAASNSWHAEAKVDASLAALTGSLQLIAAASNVSLLLDQATTSAALTAQSNVTLTTLAGSMSLASASNVNITATTGPFSVLVPNAGLTLDQGATLATSNAVTVTAGSDVALTSTTGKLTLVNSSNAWIAMSNQSIAVVAMSNIDAAASNIFLASQLGTAISVANGPLTATSALGDVSVSAWSNVAVSASNGSVALAGGLSNATLKLDAATYAVQIYATSNVQATASNSITLVADKAFSATAAKDAMTLTSASNMTLTTSSSLTQTAAADVSVTATAGALTLSAAASNATLTASNVAIVSSSNIVQEAKENLILGAGSNAFLTSSNASVAFSADQGKVTLKLDQPTDSIIGWSLSNTTFVAGQNVSMAASNSANFWALSNTTISGAGGQATMTFGVDQTISASAKSYAWAASDASGYTFQVGASNMLEILQDRVVVNGGMDILGTVNSISVQNTELHVNDKTIQLAYPLSNEVINDGSANSAAGVFINGLPASASNMNQTLAQTIYEKSFTWHYNVTGVDGLLTNSGLTQEAFWEVKGGRLQLTAHKANGDPISFALRINELDELEMVKIWVDGSSTTQTRRVAKFGRTL
jgi:hypothetical protein